MTPSFDDTDLMIGTLPMDHPDYHRRLQPVHVCMPGLPTHPAILHAIERAVRVCRMPAGRFCVWSDRAAFGVLSNRGRYVRQSSGQRWATTYRDEVGQTREVPLRFLDFSHGVTPSLQMHETEAARQCWHVLSWRALYSRRNRTTKLCLFSRAAFYWRRRWQNLAELVRSGYAPVLNPPESRSRGRPLNVRGHGITLKLATALRLSLESERMFPAALATARQWWLWSHGRYGMPWGDKGPPPGNYRHSLNTLLTLWSGVVFPVAWTCYPMLLEGIPHAGPSGSVHPASLQAVAGRVLQPGGSFELSRRALDCCQSSEHVRCLQAVYAATCTMLHAGVVLRLSGIPHEGFPALPEFLTAGVDAGLAGNPEFVAAREDVLAGRPVRPVSGYRPEVDPAYAEPDGSPRINFA